MRRYSYSSWCAGDPTVVLRKGPRIADPPDRSAFPADASRGDGAPGTPPCARLKGGGGNHANRVEILGRLPDYHTGTGYRVTPIVGWAEPPLTTARITSLTSSKSLSPSSSMPATTATSAFFGDGCATTGQ